MITCACLQGKEPAVSNVRNENLRVILEKTNLNPKMDPYFNMLIADATAQSQKTVDPEEIIKKFRSSIAEESIFNKLTASYAAFSNEEILELKRIYENPVFIKYCDRFTSENMLADMEVMKGIFKDLVDKYGVIKTVKDVALISNIIEVTKENFQKVVIESKKPVIIDVYSNTCPPCRLMEPIVEELSQEYQDVVCFVKINCEAQNELAQRYGVTALPTLLFIKSGEEKAYLKNAGFTNKKDLQAKITEFLGKTKN
jgi:thioredoxin